MSKGKETIKSRWVMVGFAFFIPLCIILISCFFGNIYPFGDNSLVYHDMQYQYTDFFMWFHQVLRGNESWNYSFHAGLGGNTTALVAYYLASPLNILLLFVPVEKIAQFLTLLIILKLCLCGVTAYFYLRQMNLSKDILAVTLSTGYALMGYNILQCSNVMWLDGVIILPVLALGIHNMIYKDKCKIYYFALVYAIVSNWYIGYMLCIFACLYFILEMVLFFEDSTFYWKLLIRKFLIFAVYSVLSLLSSCFLFVPQTLQMIRQNDGIDWSVFEPQVGFSYLEGFRDLYLQGDKLTQTDTIPPVFVGTLILLLMVIFFVYRKISRYKKMVFGVVLLAFMAMMCYKPLNYMWTGFKYPGNHYFRQAFIFGFLMLVVAGNCLKALSDVRVEKNTFAKSTAIIVGIGLLFDLLRNYEPHMGIYLSCTIAIIICCIFCFFMDGRIKRRIGITILLLCTLVEFSGKMLLEFGDHTQSTSYYTEYNQVIQNEINELKETDENFDMYRVDKTFTRSVPSGFGNESLSFGYSSIAQYASTDDTQMIDMLIRCGYGSDYKHMPYYPILPMDALLGVKYIYSRGNVYEGELLKEGIMDDICLYENPYALPKVFGIEKASASIMWSDNVFVNHEKLYDSLTGYEVELYKQAIITEDGAENDSGNAWKIQAEETGPLYLYFKYSNPGMTVEVNNTNISTVSYYNNHIMHIGEYKKGDVISVKVHNGGDLENYGIIATTLQMEHFKEAIEILKRQSATITKLTETGLLVQYDGAKEQKMLFTIPYEEGWKATVNGEKAEVQKLAGDFMGVDIKSGKNIVKLEYHTPGLLTGFSLSIIGTIGFIGCELRRRKYKNGRKNIIGNSVLQ